MSVPPLVRIHSVELDLVGMRDLGVSLHHPLVATSEGSASIRFYVFVIRVV